MKCVIILTLMCLSGALSCSVRVPLNYSTSCDIFPAKEPYPCRLTQRSDACEIEIDCDDLVSGIRNEFLLVSCLMSGSRDRFWHFMQKFDKYGNAELDDNEHYRDRCENNVCVVQDTGELERMLIIGLLSIGAGASSIILRRY